MVLFCLVNPELNAPLDIEFDRMTNKPEFREKFIANYLNASNLAAMSDRYYFQRQPNISCKSYVLTSKSERSTVIERCNGWHWGKKRKSNKLSRWHLAMPHR